MKFKWSVYFFWLGLMGIPLQASPLCDHIVHIPSMGTVFEIQYVNPCLSAEAKKHQLDIKKILDDLEASMSLYLIDSEISRLNEKGFIEEPSTHFKKIIQIAIEAGAKTDGYFDITVWPLLREIKKHFQNGSGLIDEKSLDRLKLLIDYRKIRVSAHQISFATPAMAITLDGIAKGYAVDLVSNYLEQQGITSYLVNFSGNIKLKGEHANGKKWNVAIYNPLSRGTLPVELQNESIASSGIENESYSEDGKWHHLIDPKKLRPAQAFLYTTILGPSAMVCDILSTATFVMDKEKAKKILSKNYPQYHYRLILKNKEVVTDLR